MINSVLRTDMERRLSAILAADVVDYSRLMGANEAETLELLKAVRSEFVDCRIAQHPGRIVKLTGDGMLVEGAQDAKNAGRDGRRTRRTRVSASSRRFAYGVMVASRRPVAPLRTMPPLSQPSFP